MAAATQQTVFGNNVITVWDQASVRQLNAHHRHAFDNALEELGKLSAKAQGLGRVITTVGKLLHSCDRAYLISLGQGGPVGLLRVGPKTLFIRDIDARLHEISPLCCLDFYVRETFQRQSIGRRLFDFMLEQEKRTAADLGYDSPSPKLLAFLAKHYRLQHYIPQNNHFVVFSDYFQQDSPGRIACRSSGDRFIARSEDSESQRTAVASARPLRGEYKGGEEVQPRSNHRHYQMQSSQVASLLMSPSDDSPVESLPRDSQALFAYDSPSPAGRSTTVQRPVSLLGTQFRDQTPGHFSLPKDASRLHSDTLVQLSHYDAEGSRKAELSQIETNIRNSQKRIEMSLDALKKCSEVPTCISIYGRDRHYSNERGDMIKRIHGRRVSLEQPNASRHGTRPF